MQNPKPKNKSKSAPAMVPFHSAFDAYMVDRAIFWNSKTNKTTYLKLEALAASDPTNKYGRDIKYVNGEVSEAHINHCQLLLLGGQHVTHFPIKKLSNIAGSDTAQERFGYSAIEKRGVRDVRVTQDMVIINAPKQFSHVIINPHPHLKDMGWREPLMLDVMEKPKVEQPSELFARGIDPSDECRHFVGSIEWTLTDAEIKDWEKFGDLEVEVCLYSTYKLLDMRDTQKKR